MADTEVPVLEVDDATVTYRGGARGVEHISCTVGNGEVVTLVGPNGAGKTSTLRSVSGLLRRDVARMTSGNVLFCGERINHLGPGKRAKRGIASVPERDKIFADLTVDENLEIGGIVSGRRFREQRDLALEVFPALVKHLRRPAGFLSGGQRQMLALGSALCAAPKLLVVDELTLGLSPEFVRTMTDSLAKIVSLGLPILMAEQNLAVAIELSRTLYVLDGGVLQVFGTPEDLASRSEIASTFLGRQ